MVLVANKVDLVHLRKVTSDQGQEMAAKHSVSCEPFHRHRGGCLDFTVSGGCFKKALLRKAD